jgi:maltose phosphorylase
MYFPFSEEHNVYLQQDGFLDKELVRVADLNKSKDQSIKMDLGIAYTLHQNKLMFCNVSISLKIIFQEKNLISILRSFGRKFHFRHASIQKKLYSKMDIAYTFYLRTSRLDLDDYNKEVEEGCHITSMEYCGRFWRNEVKEITLHFLQKIPKEWTAYSLKSI